MLKPTPVIIHFPAYAGGKFITNCLSYSKHCVIADASIFNTNDCNLKHKSILATLPNKDRMHEWVDNYEFNEIVNLIDKEELSKQGKMFFYTAHNLLNANTFLSEWPDSILLSLTNFWMFQRLAQSLKDPDLNRPIEFGNEQPTKYNLLRGPDWPDYKSFEANGFHSDLDEIQKFYPTKKFKTRLTFDIDLNIMDKHRFLTAIEQLYTKLGLTDFEHTKDFVEDYHTKYIFLHQRI